MNKMRVNKRILDLLKEEGYDIKEDTHNRVDQFIECIEGKKSLHTTQHILDWFENQRKNCLMSLEEINIDELEKWKVDEHKNIIHETGEFFSIRGVRINNTVFREVSSWTQPMVFQKEMGILGIIRKKINGVNHYLLNAKAEPGNVGKLLLSPTVQATFSNLKRAHKGKKTKFSEYFDDSLGDKVKTVYKRSFAEDGGRFYLKSNFNVLVEVDESEIQEIPDDFIWVTMYQIKQLLKYDNLVAPHVRSIISVL